MQKYSPNDIHRVVEAVDSMIMDKIIESSYFRPISVNGGTGKVFVPCESNEKGKKQAQFPYCDKKIGDVSAASFNHFGFNSPEVASCWKFGLFRYK